MFCFFPVSRYQHEMSPTWQYENLLGLDLEFRETARKLVQSRLPNYTDDHCVKLFGGSPYEFYSRCVLDESRNLVGVMAFSVGQLDTVEIVAFVSAVDGTGIGRFLMDSFVGEMKTKKKSSILTYIEPSAFPFFSRFSFIKQIPARSLQSPEGFPGGTKPCCPSPSWLGRRPRHHWQG